MKKIFFLAAAVAASMSMMAAVEFHYLPTAGDKNAAGVEFNTTDKVTVPAGEVFITLLSLLTMYQKLLRIYFGLEPLY